MFSLTGSAQKVPSMELVPPNSEKMIKYAGSAQYTENDKEVSVQTNSAGGTERTQ